MALQRHSVGSSAQQKLPSALPKGTGGEVRAEKARAAVQSARRVFRRTSAWNSRLTMLRR